MNKATKLIIVILMAACVMAFTPVMGEQAFAAAKKPAKVTKLTMTVNAQPYAALTWKEVKKTDGYVVYRNGKKLAKVKKGTTAYVDHKLKPGKSYSYTVKAYKKSKKKTLYGKPSSAKKIVKGFTYGKASDGKVKVTGYTGHSGDVKIPAKYSGKKVTEIGTSAFQGNLWMKTLKIPENVKAIDDYAFEACGAVKKVYFPKSLRTIGKGAFSGCGQLRLADLSDKVTKIDDGAFLYCLNLAYIDLPGDLTSLGNFAFTGSGVRSIGFGEKLTYLPERAFCNCDYLASVVIPGTIKTIGDRAFYGCDLLQKTDVPKETQLGKDVFEMCPLLNPEKPDSDGIVPNSDSTTSDDIASDGVSSDGVPEMKEYFPFKPWDAAKSLFRESDFEGYQDIHDGFDAWVAEYEKYNAGNMFFTSEYNTYMKLYTGDEHYPAMKAALNGDVGRTEQAVLVWGENFKDMYLMIDHGLSAELMRGKMPQDLILYSGLKPEQVACFAGYPIGQRDVKVSMDKLGSRIGEVVTDEAFMSTTASLDVSFGFSMDSEVIVKIYASQKALEKLGAVCVAPFSDYESEEEILFNSFAKYKVLDVGETGLKDENGKTQKRTCIVLELL